MPRWIRLLSLLTVISGLVGCDQVSKDMAKAELQNQSSLTLVRNALELCYTENHDVAFNALRFIPESPRKALILVTGGLAIAALGVALLRLRGKAVTVLGFAAILAGALGNYWDRLARGYVVDFVHLEYWPVFNLADVYVTLGIVLLVFANLRPHAFSRT